MDGCERRRLRRRGRGALGLAAVLAVTALGAGGPGSANAARSDALTSCEDANSADQATLMRQYDRAGRYDAGQADGRDGIPESVSVVIPPIRFVGPGRSTTLPVGPCQTIHRYRYRDLRAPARAASQPFQYVEIDWNTEGLSGRPTCEQRPPGPPGSRSAIGPGRESSGWPSTTFGC